MAERWMPEPPDVQAAAGSAAPPPAQVLALAGGEAIRPAWDNVAGGRTFEVGAGERRR